MFVFFSQTSNLKYLRLIDKRAEKHSPGDADKKIHSVSCYCVLTYTLQQQDIWDTHLKHLRNVSICFEETVRPEKTKPDGLMSSFNFSLFFSVFAFKLNFKPKQKWFPWSNHSFVVSARYESNTRTRTVVLQNLLPHEMSKNMADLV